MKLSRLLLGAALLLVPATSAIASIAISTVTSGGWTQCYSAPYGQYGTSIASAVSTCSGTNMMLAAGATGSTDLLLLAWAPTADVMFDTGQSNTPHNANNVGWYFNGSYSWGFAPQGAAISRNSCDTVSAPGWSALDGSENYRLCWHTGSGEMNGGWRAGSAVNLNGSSDYTKYIFTSDNPTYAPSGVQIGAEVVVPEPMTSSLVGLGLAATAVFLRRRRQRA